MITSSYYDNDILKYVTNFYLNQISQPDFINYFNIYFTNNILEDIKIFNDGKTSEILPDGVIILPLSQDEMITILINENSPKEFQSQYIIHELCHLYDFMLFADKYCNGHPHLIRKNNFWTSLKYWSEFHVQLYTIPYSQAFLTFLSEGKHDYFESFLSSIGTFYYKEFNERFLNKEDIYLVDIMYYIGKIVMCNQYDKTTEYALDKRIVNRYPFIYTLNLVLKDCLSFETFCDNLDVLHQILNSEDLLSLL